MSPQRTGMRSTYTSFFSLIKPTNYNCAMPRESMQYDVVVVGAGPAGLAAAIRGKQLASDVSVRGVGKGSQGGAPLLSGPGMEPIRLAGLIPHREAHGRPVQHP